MDKLRAIQYFIHAVESGSFAAAARHFEVSPPAVTKLIAGLERDLGTTLLRRDSRRLLLTADGDRYLKVGQRLLTELRATEAELSTRRSKAQGKLVVGISRTVAQHCLMPGLGAFCERYPDLSLDFRNVNFAHEPLAALCDVLLLMGWQEDSNWVAQQIARGRHSVVAAPAFWKRHGMPRDPRDLVRYPCLALRVPRGVILDRWKFSRGPETREVEPASLMVFDDRDTLIEGVLRGYGMHFGNDLTLLPWLLERRIEVALMGWVGHDAPPVHLMYRRRGRQVAAVRAFGDFVTRLFAELLEKRKAFGPPDTTAMPDWFRARYVGRLTDRPANCAA